MSSNGARRKRPSAPTDSGLLEAQGKTAYGVGSAEGGAASVTARCPGNPYDFDDDGALSTQQQQMLRVLEQHKTALSSTQQEVYERLRRKAAKANVAGFSEGWSLVFLIR